MEGLQSEQEGGEGQKSLTRKDEGIFGAGTGPWIFREASDTLATWKGGTLVRVVGAGGASLAGVVAGGEDFDLLVVLSLLS